MGQFGIGQPLARVEDARLLTGHGQYTDDINRENQAFMVLVRSPHAHADIAGIDATAAREVPGVLAVYTAADLGASDVPGTVPLRTSLPEPDGPESSGWTGLARRVGIKLGERGVRFASEQAVRWVGRRTRTLPLVGGVVGGYSDLQSTQAVARRATNCYLPEEQ
jgi:CO/xanthine dehydrogenase Mo-binding subunit